MSNICRVCARNRSTSATDRHRQQILILSFIVLHYLQVHRRRTPSLLKTCECRLQLPTLQNMVFRNLCTNDVVAHERRIPCHNSDMWIDRIAQFFVFIATWHGSNKEINQHLTWNNSLELDAGGAVLHYANAEENGKKRRHISQLKPISVFANVEPFEPCLWWNIHRFATVQL